MGSVVLTLKCYIVPYNSKKALRAALLAAEEKTAEHLSLTCDTQDTADRKQEECEGVTSAGEEVKERATSTESQENRTTGANQDDCVSEGSKGLEGVGQIESLESSLDHKDTASTGHESSAGSQGEVHLPGEGPLPRLQSSNEELLAIMGNSDSPRVDFRRDSSHTASEYSGDSFLSDLPCFLHIRLSHKSSATHTYTPLNLAVGIDIPHGDALSANKALVQKVQTTFCFAVADCRLVSSMLLLLLSQTCCCCCVYDNYRVSDLVGFISRYHPGGGLPCERHNPSSSSSWSNGVFEFISYDESPSHEVCAATPSSLLLSIAFAGLEFQ